MKYSRDSGRKSSRDICPRDVFIFDTIGPFCGVGRLFLRGIVVRLYGLESSELLNLMIVENHFQAYAWCALPVLCC